MKKTRTKSSQENREAILKTIKEAPKQIHALQVLAKKMNIKKTAIKYELELLEKEGELLKVGNGKYVLKGEDAEIPPLLLLRLYYSIKILGRKSIIAVDDFIEHMNLKNYKGELLKKSYYSRQEGKFPTPTPPEGTNDEFKVIIRPNRKSLSNMIEVVEKKLEVQLKDINLKIVYNK